MEQQIEEFMMDREEVLAYESDALSVTEFKVYQILMNGDAQLRDVPKIASISHLTDIEVMVALQLLTHKGVLPADRTID